MKRILLLLFFRGYIIKRLRNKYFGTDLINHVLKSLGLPETGLPKWMNPPPPPEPMVKFDGLMKYIKDREL